MTTKEWAKEYPEIAASLFKCSINDLDNVIEEEEKRFKSQEGEYYLTRADVSRLVEISNVVMRDSSTNEYTFNGRNLNKGELCFNIFNWLKRNHFRNRRSKEFG